MRTPSLVTHLTKACVPHCVITEREKAKSVGHKEEWRVIHFFHLYLLLPHPPSSPTEGFPPWLSVFYNQFELAVYVCVLSEAPVFEPKHWRMSEALRRREDTEVVLNILVSVTEINKMSVEKGLRNRSKWQCAQSLKTFACYIMRGTSFKLPWNLRDVKQ